MNNQKPAITIINLNKAYQNKLIFNNLNLIINQGEFVCVIGPNGCGKTTLLKIIAGLEDYNGVITKQTPYIGYISQNPRDMLFPWMTVKANIIFPLNKKGVDRELLEQLLTITRLKDYQNKFPYQLSGGMAQLLLVARALHNKSKIILMDEPFKSLDFEISKKIQLKILKLWKQYQPTIVMVSHDIDEAIFMANRIIIFPNKEKGVGKIVPINLPRERELSIITNKKFLNIKKTVFNALLN